MVKIRTFLFVVCFVWMLFDEGHGEVQIYNRESDGSGPRNISVNIHGANGGNICIDCQNQIQVDSGLEKEPPLVNYPQLQQLFGPNDPYFNMQPKPIPSEDRMLLAARPDIERQIPGVIKISPKPFYKTFDDANNDDASPNNAINDDGNFNNNAANSKIAINDDANSNNANNDDANSNNANNDEANSNNANNDLLPEDYPPGNAAYPQSGP